MNPIIKLYNLNAVALMDVVDKCKGNVYLVTEEGDKLNLKSKLCQFMGLARLIEGGIIAKACIECDNDDDYTELINFCINGVA